MSSTLTQFLVDRINGIPRVTTKNPFLNSFTDLTENRCINISLPRGFGKTAAIRDLHALVPDSIVVVRHYMDSTYYTVDRLFRYFNDSCRGTRNIVSNIFIDEVPLAEVLNVIYKFPQHISPNLVIVRLGTDCYKRTMAR